MQHYDPAIFKSVTSLQAAKRIILTDERTLTTDERWERETPHIRDLIVSSVRLSHESVVLDYGCGVGRLAKALIRSNGCRVIGADIAPNMQAFAASYVASEQLILCHPSALSLLGTKVDIAIAVWVLQHVDDLSLELIRIRDMLKPDGRLFVVNEGSSRFVPTSKGWANDNVNVRDELKARFNEIACGHLDPAVVGEEQSQRTFWAIYGR